MIGQYILLEDHTAVPVDDMMAWGAFMEGGIENRRVGYTEIDNYKVYTTFLGLDHAWNGGPPLLFETMIQKADEWLGYQERCSTWQEAEIQHELALIKVRSGEVE